MRLSNVAAQGLYHQFGFEPAGIRQKYYENVEDAIVMWCRGIDTPEPERDLIPSNAPSSVWNQVIPSFGCIKPEKSPVFHTGGG